MQHHYHQNFFFYAADYLIQIYEYEYEFQSLTPAVSQI